MNKVEYLIDRYINNGMPALQMSEYYNLRSRSVFKKRFGYIIQNHYHSFPSLRNCLYKEINDEGESESIDDGVISASVFISLFNHSELRI
jgi:hypothetical protein